MIAIAKANAIMARMSTIDGVALEFWPLVVSGIAEAGEADASSRVIDRPHEAQNCAPSLSEVPHCSQNMSRSVAQQ